MKTNGHQPYPVIPIQRRYFHWQLPAPPVDAGKRHEAYRIDLLRNAQDNHAATLAALGFSYECIAHHTKLSKSQVASRLKRHNISPKHYRNGKTAIANLVIQRVGEQAAKILNQGLMQLEENNPTGQNHASA